MIKEKSPHINSDRNRRKVSRQRRDLVQFMYDNGYFFDFFEISEVISDICMVLDIEEPSVCIDDGGQFHTSTTMAMIDLTDRILYLNPQYFSPDIKFGPVHIFTLGHELRHLFQYEHGEMFENYKSSNKISLEKYNMQLVEIDANAFGLICVFNWYDEDCFWDFLSALQSDESMEKVWNISFEHMKSIMKPELMERLISVFDEEDDVEAKEE